MSNIFLPEIIKLLAYLLLDQALIQPILKIKIFT